LDPPIDFIPENEFYCHFCIEKYGLVNDFVKPAHIQNAPYSRVIKEVEMIPPEPDLEEFLDSSQNGKEKSKKNKKRGRKAGKGKNPLEGVTEFIKFQKKLNSSQRKERVEKRRASLFAEEGSVARRRRFRPRESIKDSRKVPKIKEEYVSP
jgi:hypothetical protein